MKTYIGKLQKVRNARKSENIPFSLNKDYLQAIVNLADTKRETNQKIKNLLETEGQTVFIKTVLMEWLGAHGLSEVEVSAVINK